MKDRPREIEIVYDKSGQKLRCVVLSFTGKRWTRYTNPRDALQHDLTASQSRYIHKISEEAIVAYGVVPDPRGITQKDRLVLFEDAVDMIADVASAHGNIPPALRIAIDAAVALG